MMLDRDAIEVDICIVFVQQCGVKGKKYLRTSSFFKKTPQPTKTPKPTNQPTPPKSSSFYVYQGPCIINPAT